MGKEEKQRLKIAKAKQALEGAILSAQTGLQGVETLSKNLDKLGIFVAGVYGTDHKPIMAKILGGVKALIGLKLAQSPNLAAGAAGLAWTTATLLKAGNKAVSNQG